MALLQETLKKRGQELLRAGRPWLYFWLAFLFFDALFFRWLFWSLPDESAWAGQPHYHFLHKLQGMAPGSTQSPLVLVVGSSIAVYSLLPEEIENYINKPSLLQDAARKRRTDFLASKKALSLGASPQIGQVPKRHVRVRMLAHQGMTPLHLYALLPEILRLRPSIILYPVNPVDFRIEKPFVNKNFRSVVSKNERLRQKALGSFIRTITQEKEFLALAPMRTLRLYGKRLPVSTNADLLLGGLFASWRYRDLAQDALEGILKNHFSSARHYQNYAGSFVAGLSRRGWAAKHFSFLINSHLKKNGIYFQARPCLFQKNRQPALRYRFCRPEAKARLPALPWPIEQGRLSFGDSWALRLYASPRGFHCSGWKNYALQRGWQRLPLWETTMRGIGPHKVPRENTPEGTPKNGSTRRQDSSESARRAPSNMGTPPKRTIKWFYGVKPRGGAPDKRTAKASGDANNFRGGNNKYIYFEGKVADACFDDFSADLRSLRFPRNFGYDSPHIRKREGRAIRREDLLYFLYTDKEYKKSYQKRILNFGRAGAAYLAALHDAKRKLSKEPFRKALPTFAAFLDIQKAVQENNIKFISWSSPENPLSLSLYGDSAWHKGFENFIERNAPPALWRRRLQERFRMQDFYDYHHMTYFGAQKMSKILQKILLLVEREQADALGR